MTLSCDTRLPWDRSGTQLRYSFFRDDHTLRSDGSSSEFQISAIQKEDSGYYWCEVATASHSVLKQSHRSHVLVQSESQGQGCRLRRGPAELSRAPGETPAVSTLSLQVWWVWRVWGSRDSPGLCSIGGHRGTISLEPCSRSLRNDHHKLSPEQRLLRSANKRQVIAVSVCRELPPPGSIPNPGGATAIAAVAGRAPSAEKALPECQA